LLAWVCSGPLVRVTVLRRCSRAAAQALTRCFINTGWARPLCGNREWAPAPGHPHHRPSGMVECWRGGAV